MREVIDIKPTKFELKQRGKKKIRGLSRNLGEEDEVGPVIGGGPFRVDIVHEFQSLTTLSCRNWIFAILLVGTKNQGVLVAVAIPQLHCCRKCFCMDIQAAMSIPPSLSYLVLVKFTPVKNTSRCFQIKLLLKATIDLNRFVFTVKMSLMCQRMTLVDYPLARGETIWKLVNSMTLNKFCISFYDKEEQLDR